MALPYPTLALIFLVIVPMALGRATFAEANEEAGKKHKASANATAPANPSPVRHPIEASEGSAANGHHVGDPASSVVEGHHPPGKGHHEKSGHRKKGGHCKKGGPCKGGHRKKAGHRGHLPASAPAGAPASPTIVVPPAIVPADAPASSPVTVAPPTAVPAAAPPTASPPSGDRIQIPPTLKKLLPSLPPSAEPQELKELISKATGVDPSKIPELTDPKQIEEVVAKTVGTNALPPNADAKQIENLISQASGMNATDALATVQESSDVESLLSKAMGSLAPSGDAGAAGTPALNKEASSAFSTEATSMAIALVAAVAVACLNF